jgi:hypothetical protein
MLHGVGIVFGPILGMGDILAKEDLWDTHNNKVHLPSENLIPKNLKVKCVRPGLNFR